MFGNMFTIKGDKVLSQNIKKIIYILLVCVMLFFSLSSCVVDNDGRMDLSSQDSSQGVTEPSVQSDTQNTAEHVSNLTGESQVEIGELSEWQRELIEGSRIIGKTLAEIEAIFGELIVYETEGGGYTARAEHSTELTFFFRVDPRGDKAASDSFLGYCSGLAGPLNELLPSLNEVIPSTQLSEMFGVPTMFSEADRWTGEYIVSCYIEFIPNYMRTMFAEEINEEFWGDVAAYKMFIILPESLDEIKPKSIFSLFLADSNELLSWKEELQYRTETPN